jgi:hypothetical protein
MVGPICILESNSVIERKRMETYFISQLQPNLNGRIFQPRYKKLPIKLKPYRPLKKFRDAKKYNTFCNCLHGSTFCDNSKCWLKHEFEKKKSNNSLTKYLIRSETRNKKSKYKTGYALDIMLSNFTENENISIYIKPGHNNLSDRFVLKHDFGNTKIQNSKHTWNDIIHNDVRDLVKVTLIFSNNSEKILLEKLKKLAHKPFTMRRLLSKISRESLLNLVYRANSIQNLTIRKKTKSRLFEIIFNRFGLIGLKNLHCTFQYSHLLDTKQIRHILKRVMSHIELNENLKSELLHTIRLTQKRR